MTKQDTLDMRAAMVRGRDIEESLVQGYNYNRKDALNLINEALA